MNISNKAAAIVSGTALVIHGALKRGPLGAIAIGIGGIITYLGISSTQEPLPAGRQLLRKSHTVEVEPYDAFVQWKDLTNLHNVFSGLRGVKSLDNGNWSIPLPGLGRAEVQVTHEQPGHVIEWRTLEGSKIEGHGLIRFTRKKNGRGTKIHHEISFGAASQPSATPELQNA